MAELITISSGELTAAINPLGAELWSLTDALGAEYMTNADPAFWTGHAPILFPIVGELNGGSYRHDGQDYLMQRHGFARTKTFEVAEAGADIARFVLRDSEATRGVYPFAFTLELVYRLAGATLAVAAVVTNGGERPMPFSIGFHPAFAWPLPGGADKAAHRVTFAQPEPEPIRRLSQPEGLTLPGTFPSPVEGHGFTPDASLFKADAMIWDRVNSRAVTFGPAAGTQVSISFPDAHMLGVWQKPGASFLCIEPWQGLADPVGFTGDLRDKPGIVMLAPGAEYRFRMDVSLVSF
jgi:galactose mutarotase-like enzyme